MSILPLDESGRFVVVDGLADLPGGGIGSLIWTYDPDAGFERVAYEGPPMATSTLWRTGEAVELLGVPCPGITSDRERIGDDYFGEWCSRGRSVLVRIDPSTREATTLADDLPGAWDLHVNVVASPGFTLLEAASPSPDPDGWTSDFYELDESTGRLRKLGTAPLSTTCRSGDALLRVPTGAMRPEEPGGSGSASVVGSEGPGPPLAIPAPPGAIVGTWGRCDPAGGIRYRSADLTSSAAWVLDLEGDSLRWRQVPPAPDAPGGGAVSDAGGHSFTWHPIAGEDSFDHWDFYELVDGQWHMRGSVKGPDQPSQVTFSGPHALGITHESSTPRHMLRELP